MEFKKIWIILISLWWTYSAQAQQGNFCADYKFICKGGIDEKGIGLQGNNPSFCYKWDNPALLDKPTSANPKITVVLNEKKTFSVTVTTPEGDKYEDKITVLVYSLDLEISLPKIDGGAIVAEADEQTIGSQTFINIDNDDADATPDLNDNLVLGGDNELMKLKGKIKFHPDAVVALKNNEQGTDLSAGAERSLPKLVDFNLLLKATKGDKNIALWKWEDKREKSGYTFKKDSLIDGTSEFFFERWIEGIEGNDVTRGTELELSLDNAANLALAPSAACAKDVVACTIVEITSVKWLGMGNGACNDEALASKNATFEGDYLDKDTEYGATNSVRVFPDGRITGGIVGLSKNKVRIKVTTKCALGTDAKIYLRAFDMDDPSQNRDSTSLIHRPERGELILDPNDMGRTGTYAGGAGLTYDIHNDNRVKGRKYGSTYPDSSKMNALGIFKLEIPASKSMNEPNNALFQVSEFAGDNYALFAARDSSYLLQLENLDSLDGKRIVNIKMSRKEALTSDSSRISPILTVWRLLHIEYDQMKKPTNTGNILSGLVKKIELVPGTTDLNSVEVDVTTPALQEGIIYTERVNKFSSYLTTNILHLYDGSPALEVYDTSRQNIDFKGKGRFENGRINIGVLDFNSANLVVTANGKHKVEIMKTKFPNFKCSLRNLSNVVLGTGNIKNISIIPGTSGGLDRYKITLETFVPNTINFDLIEKISIGNASNYVPAVNVDKVNKNLEVFDLDIPFSIIDDDKLDKINEGISLDTINKTYNSAYIQAVREWKDDPAFSSVLPFKANIRHVLESAPEKIDDWLAIEDYRDSKNIEKPNFWISYVLNAFQSDFISDKDGDICPYDLWYFYGMTDDVEEITLSDTDLVKGANLCAIFRETIREEAIINAQSMIIAHEIGHQFGLSHGNLLNSFDKTKPTIPEFNQMKAMAATFKVSNSTELIPRHLNLVRSRYNSPGIK